MAGRTRQRFNQLERELKASGYTASDGRAGEYFNYKKGINKIEVKRRPTAAHLKRFNVGAIPFGISPAGVPDTNPRETSMTV